jgi:hypothetical protein
MAQQFPQVYDMQIFQGSYFQRTIAYSIEGFPFNLTGYTVRGQIRAAPSRALVLSFDCTIPNPTDGKIYIEILATDTVNVSLPSGVYDIEIVPPTGEDFATRILMGSVTISPEVTK